MDIDGIKNAGRKIAYANFLPELPTSYAMFIQAGPWMIVLRVSAKAGREDDAERAIDVLAAEASFDKGSEPVEARVINVESCGQQLPMKSAGMAKPATAEVATLAALADGVIHDDKGHSVKEAIGRVPNRLCLISNDSFNGHPRMTFITMEDGGPIMRPAVFQLYGDAGIIVEITALQKGPQRFYVVRNAIGSAVIAGTFDQIPSAGQLEAIFNRGPSIPLVAMAESDGKTSRQTIDCSLTKEGCAAGD